MRKSGWKNIILILLFAAMVLLFAGCREKEQSFESALQRINEGRYEDALSYLNLSISQGNSDKLLYAHKAIVLLKLERESEAEVALSMALSGDASLEVKKLEAIYYFEKGDKETAKAKFVNVKQLTEEAGEDYDPEVLGYIARILIEEEDYEQAVPYLNRVILCSYHLKEHEMLAGICYLKQSQFKAAGQYFEMVDQVADRQPSDYLYMYDSCMEVGAYSLAETVFEKGRKLCGTKNQEMTEGEYYARAGLLKQAEEVLVKENTVGSLLTQAWILAQNGSYSESEKIYESLIAGNEDIEEVYVAYMAEKVMAGDASGAKILLEKIKTFEDEKILKRAAWNEIILYEKSGEFQQAYEALCTYKNTYGADETENRELIFLERVLK